MGVLDEYYAALGRPDLPVRGHPRAVRRRRPDGVLQRPGALRRRTDARDPDERRDAHPGPRAWRSRGRARGTTSRSASGSPRATRPWAGSASTGGTTTRRSAASRTWPPGCAPTPNPWQILVTERVFTAAGPIAWRGRRHPRAARLQPERPRLRRQGHRQRADRVMTGDLWTPPAVGPDVLSRLDEDERYQPLRPAPGPDGRGLGGDAAQPRRRVGGRRSPRSRSTAPWRRAGRITQAMEERFLFLLMLLRQPRLRMVYVTSLPIAPEIIEYYLALLPGVIPSHARSRLSLVAVDDASPRSLSEKLLERPHLLARIAALIPNRERSHLVPYNTTELERDVALSLGIPMYGADPRLAPLGSKTGCRRMFAEVGVPHPLGVENLRTLDDMADAVVGMRAERPTMDSVIVKLNEGVSGSGNALVRLSGLPAPGSSDERAAVLERLRGWSWSRRDHAARRLPGQVRARVPGSSRSGSSARSSSSPSVQLRVLPGGAVELLSTHDQLLGGASGQNYLGCMFPAAPEYARAITQHAETIGQRLAEQGALGRFAVDFVVVRGDDGEWTPYAIELNLRKGGTTHPFLTLQFLTDGRYDPTTALFLTPRGHEKHLVATDHLESELLRGLSRVRPVRHRGPTRAALRPVTTGRHRVPHDQLPHRARPDRPHGGRRHSGRGATGATARPSASCWRRRGRRSRGSGRCRSERAAADLVRRLRLEPRARPVPLLPVRRSPGRRRPRLPRLPRPERPRARRGRRRAGRPRVRRRVPRVGRRDGVLRPRRRRGRGRAAPTWSRPTSSATSRPRSCGAPPGGEFARDLAGLLPDVESVVATGPGRYETVVRLGELDGAPMFTITHHDVGEPAARGADSRRTSSGSRPVSARRTGTTTPGSPATSPRLPALPASGPRRSSRSCAGRSRRPGERVDRPSADHPVDGRPRVALHHGANPCPVTGQQQVVQEATGHRQVETGLRAEARPSGRHPLLEVGVRHLHECSRPSTCSRIRSAASSARDLPVSIRRSVLAGSGHCVSCQGRSRAPGLDRSRRQHDAPASRSPRHRSWCGPSAGVWGEPARTVGTSHGTTCPEGFPEEEVRTDTDVR